MRGEWEHLYRAGDRDGKTVDLRLSARRNVAAAKAFLRKAMKSQGRAPSSITLDDYAASLDALRVQDQAAPAIWNAVLSAWLERQSTTVFLLTENLHHNPADSLTLSAVNRFLFLSNARLSQLSSSHKNPHCGYHHH
jgi:transposase-like protein